MAEARRLAPWIDWEQLLGMAGSHDPRQRLVALCVARHFIDGGESPLRYLAMARQLVNDPDNTCRWQAMIIGGECRHDDPEAVWAVIVEHGDSDDVDMRTAVACVLLEELLDLYFAEYFPRFRQLILGGRTGFLKTLDMCWLDDRGPNYQKAQRFVRNASRGSAPADW